MTHRPPSTDLLDEVLFVGLWVCLVVLAYCAGVLIGELLWY